MKNLNTKYAIFWALIFFVSFKSFAQTQSDPALIIAPSDSPQIIYAEPKEQDPYFPYKPRPLKNSERALLYPRSIVDNLAQLAYTDANLVPWSIKGLPQGDKGIYKLRDIVLDKVVDPLTGKTYSMMYHGTTSELLDIFKEGARAIRFDVATHVVLGMGFYLSASMNEAKAYACDRWKERSVANKNIRGMLLMVGVEDNDIIQGKQSPEAQLSNDKTGEPLDPQIFFKRKNGPVNFMDSRYNQFSFFRNVAPYLKIFKIIIFPDAGFGRTEWVQDYDGQADTANARYKTNPIYKCN
jgi:hypothetical protein